LFIKKDLTTATTTRIVYKKGFNTAITTRMVFYGCYPFLGIVSVLTITTRIVYKKGFNYRNNYKDCL